MIEVILRETKEVQIDGRRIKIITEARVCSFKRHCDFKRAMEKMRDIFSQCILVSDCLKAGIIRE